MPLFSQDPEVSRRGALGMGAGLLDTYGKPAGAVLSQSLLLGQQNADAERELRLKDAQAEHFRYGVKTGLGTFAKELHKSAMTDWEIKARRSAFDGSPIPPPPTWESSVAEATRLFGGQAAGLPGGSMPPAGNPGQGEAITPPPGVGQPPGTSNAPGGLLGPSGGQPPQAGPQLLPGTNGGAPQQAGPRPLTAADLMIGNARAVMGGLEVPRGNAQVASDAAPKMVGQYRYDPITRSLVREAPADMEYAPDGSLVNRRGLPQAQAQAESVKETQRVGTAIENVGGTNFLATNRVAAERAPLPINVPGAPGKPPRMMTEGQMRAEAAGSGIVTGPSNTELRAAEIQKERATVDRDTFNRVYVESEEKRTVAADTIMTAQAARGVMPKETDRLESFLLPVRQWLYATTGLNRKDTEEVWKAEGFKGLMNRALIGTQKDFKGSVSNVEYQTAQLTIANIANTRTANEFLLDYTEAAAKKQQWYSQKVAEIQAKTVEAERAGQTFDATTALSKLNKLRDNPASSVFATPFMARWNIKVQ